MRKFTKLLTALLLIIVIIALYFKKPIEGGIFPPCPFLYITGYYCPGCGSLRGIHSLLHGDILRALDLNPIMVLSLPFITYLVLNNSSIKIKGKRIMNTPMFSRKFYLSLLSIIMGYWIVRNINIYPFTILAP